MKKYYSLKIIIVCLFFLGCDAEVPVDPGAALLASRAEILLTMDPENFILTISTNGNFASTSLIAFEVVYNTDVFSINSYQNGDGTQVWSSLEESDLDISTAGFIFSSIKASQTIVTIDFSNPSNYTGTRLYLTNFIIKDANSNTIYFECDNSSYVDQAQCENNGNRWKTTENFHSYPVCYIDEAPITLEMDDQYEWANHYCTLKHDDGP